MSNLWHKPQMIPIRPRKPRMLFIGDCTRTPAVWYLEPLKKYFEVFHVGSGSQDLDITNIRSDMKINRNELGTAEVRERSLSFSTLFELIGSRWDIIFHIQDYTMFTDTQKCPIPYIFMCNEAAFPIVPHSAWVVLASVELIKRQVKRDWVNFPNIMYAPYALPAPPDVKFPEGPRDLQTSFAGELYSLQLYQERAEIVKYLHEKCVTEKIPSQFHYLFPRGFSVFTEFTYNEIQKGFDFTIASDIRLFVPEESGACLLSVDKTKLGVMDKVIDVLIRQELAKIKFKSKSTEEKVKILTQKLHENSKHDQSPTRHPEAGSGLLGVLRYNDLLQNTKVALNIPTPAGFNFRDIEICLSGAMLLTKHTTDHDLLGFEDGVNCRYYSSKEEALEIIKNGYDPAIAMRGWDLVIHGRSFWKHSHGYFGNVRFNQLDDRTEIKLIQYNPEIKTNELLETLQKSNTVQEFSILNNEITMSVQNEKMIDVILQSFQLTNWNVDGMTIGHRLKNLMVIFEKFAGIPKPDVSELIPK